MFRYQHTHNSIYRSYCDALHIDSNSVKKLQQIPFLPISFFRTHNVIVNQPHQPELVFESSGTSAETTSRHYVLDAEIYRQSLLQGFEQFYGSPDQYAILALLPSYLERKNASLVYMAKTLMEVGKHPDNGFYINEYQTLAGVLAKLKQAKQKVLLLGVTFALLDFATAYSTHPGDIIVMETGGMKGRRQELTRSEVHDILKQQWGLSHIHSEYGMTELLSQAYSMGEGIFSCTNTMKVMIRDVYDPLDVSIAGKGCLNIVDLANIYSCSFISTDDIGVVNADGTFEVQGRLDNSALRGCNLMVL